MLVIAEREVEVTRCAECTHCVTNLDSDGLATIYKCEKHNIITNLGNYCSWAEDKDKRLKEDISKFVGDIKEKYGIGYDKINYVCKQLFGTDMDDKD